MSTILRNGWQMFHLLNCYVSSHCDILKMKPEKMNDTFVKAGLLAIAFLVGIFLNWLIGVTFDIDPFTPIGAVIIPGHTGIFLSIFLYQYLCQRSERRTAKSNGADTYQKAELVSLALCGLGISELNYGSK